MNTSIDCQPMPGEDADAAVLLDWVAGFYQRAFTADPAAGRAKGDTS